MLYTWNEYNIMRFLSHFSRVQFWNAMDCSPPGSSVHGIFQARTLEWVAMSSSRWSSQARDWTCVSCGSCIEGRFFTTDPPGKPHNMSIILQFKKIITFCIFFIFIWECYIFSLIMKFKWGRFFMGFWIREFFCKAFEIERFSAKPQIWGQV